MRYKGIVKRVILELVRDHRTLLLMMVAPILIISLMKVVFDTNSDVHVKIGYHDLSHEITELFPKDNVTTKEYTHKINAKEAIQNDNLDAFINISGDELTITYENSDPSDTAKIKAMLHNALSSEQILEMRTIIQQQAKALKQASDLIARSIGQATPENTAKNPVVAH